MSRPRLLDLFCGGGGVGMGYSRAGFDVVGVDIKPQPNYPFKFWRGDALVALRSFWWLGFDAIHASPPCQRWTIGQNASKNADAHPDLITPLRPLLEATGLPYVIENVPKAPIRADIILCGTQFGLQYEGFELRRHRHFELNWDFGALVPPCSHTLPAAPVFGHSASRDFRRLYGRDFGAEAKREIMGVPWMTREESREAIPPAFTQFIGEQLLRHLAAGERLAPNGSWTSPATPLRAEEPGASLSRTACGYREHNLECVLRQGHRGHHRSMQTAWFGPLNDECGMCGWETGSNPTSCGECAEAVA